MGKSTMGKDKQELRGLSREDMLSWKSHELHEMVVPGTGGVVYIKSLSGKERSRYLQALGEQQERYKETNDPADMMQCAIALIVACCCDSDGNQLFTDDDFDAINEWPGHRIDAISTEAVKYNCLDQDSAEQVEKN